MIACHQISCNRTAYKSVIPFPTPFSFSFHAIMPTLLITAILFFSLNLSAESQKNGDHNQVLVERSAKIVSTLGITDSVKYNKVVYELVNQYEQLNLIHDQCKANIADIKKQTLSDDEKAAAIKTQEGKKSTELLKLHDQFIAGLQKDLTNEQIDKIKDGMTYRVFPITYAAYNDMLTNLTPAQKDKIYNWLKEARELAMDEGSSDDKHKVFGKYKGRINNYLSAEGYDLKKETADWQARIKERDTQKKNIQN